MFVDPAISVPNMPKPAPLTPEITRENLKNPSISWQETAGLMARLSNMIFGRIQDGRATDEEREQMKLLKDALSGNISSADTERLAFMLKMSPEKIAEVAEHLAGPDKDPIK